MILIFKLPRSDNQYNIFPPWYSDERLKGLFGPGAGLLDGQSSCHEHDRFPT
jgi:hypothetical protein